MEGFDWVPEFLSVARLDHEDGEPGAPLQISALEECEGFPEGDESFVDFLDGLLAEATKRKADTGAGAACKVWDLLDDAEGKADRALLEQRMLMATDLASFTEGAHELYGRILELPTSAPGLLVCGRMALTFGEGATGSQLLTLFYLPFQDAHRLRTDRGLALDRVVDVVVKNRARSFLYPYLEEGVPRHDLVKVMVRPASDPFPEILSMKPPPTTETLLQAEVARALYARGPGQEQRYAGYFEKPPAKKRELFGEERLVKVGDLLPIPDAAAVARESSRSSKDLYAKDQKMKLTIDGAVKVDASLEQLGQSYFFAEHGGERFLVIRGRSFVTTQAHLSSLDFLEVESLDQALDRIKRVDG